MTSREIAELVGSRHSDVMRAVSRLMDKLVISGCAPSAYTHAQNGQPYVEYLITKRDSFVVVAQLCPEFTAALVDRWQELEALQVKPSLPTYADTLRLYADQLEQTERANALLAIAAPKAAFVDQYVDSTGLLGFRQVAKVLGVKELAFREMLLSEGIMYFLAGKLTPYAQHIDAGRFEVKTGTSEENGHAFAQSKWTPKGVEWIAAKLAAHKLKQGN